MQKNFCIFFIFSGNYRQSLKNLLICYCPRIHIPSLFRTHQPALLQVKRVRTNFLTLVVQLTISFILSFITQVITTETSSDLSRKVCVTAYKGDTYGAVSL